VFLMLVEVIIEKIGFSAEQQKEYFEYKSLAGNKIFDFAKAYMKGEISFLEAIEKAHLLQNENLHKYTLNALFVIECMPFLLEKYREKSVSEEIFINSMKDLKYKLDEAYRVYGVFGVEPITWYERFLDMRRFAFGRLQFNIDEFELDDVTLNGYTVKKGDFALACHIPSAGPLKPEMCKESFNMAYNFFKDKAMNGILPVTCYSWLLYPPYKTVFGDNSNTGDFIKNFKVVDVQETLDFSDSWRVFGMNFDGEVSKLPQDTTMQKSFVEYINQGGSFGCGYGLALLDGKNVLTRK